MLAYLVTYYATAVFGWTKVSQLAPSKFTVVPEPPLIFGKFLQSSAGTTYMNIWRQRKKWCSVANWEPFQGVLATNLLKNRVVPALLFSLPLRATLQVLAIFGSRKPLWVILIMFWNKSSRWNDSPIRFYTTPAPSFQHLIRSIRLSPDEIYLLSRLCCGVLWQS